MLGDTFYDRPNNVGNPLFWNSSGALIANEKEERPNQVASYQSGSGFNYATKIRFNASLSNSIFGASNTVQPLAISSIVQFRF